jgi:hypothetical protein
VRKSGTGPHLKDVQLLLWAAGEARDRAKGRDRVRTNRAARDAISVPDGSEFFTEWQPVHP